MKKFLLLSVVLFVGAAEAKISIPKSQDVLAKTLAHNALSKFLAAPVSINKDKASLTDGELTSVSVEVVQSSGDPRTYVQKFVYAVKGESGKSYECKFTVNSTLIVSTGFGGISSSKLSDPEVASDSLSCR